MTDGPICGRSGRDVRHDGALSLRSCFLPSSLIDYKLLPKRPSVQKLMCLVLLCLINQSLSLREDPHVPGAESVGASNAVSQTQA